MDNAQLWTRSALREYELFSKSNNWNITQVEILDFGFAFQSQEAAVFLSPPQTQNIVCFDKERQSSPNLLG